MSESMRVNRGGGVSEKLKNVGPKALIAIAGLGLIGGGVFAYEQITEEDKSDEVEGYLQARDINKVNVKVSKDAETIQLVCPESDDFSDPLSMEVTRHLGQIGGVSVVIPSEQSTSYRNADGEVLFTEIVEQDPLTFSLDDPESQASLEQFIAKTNACEASTSNE